VLLVEDLAEATHDQRKISLFPSPSQASEKTFKFVPNCQFLYTCTYYLSIFLCYSHLCNIGVYELEDHNLFLCQSFWSRNQYPVLFFIICLDVWMEMTTDISMEATY